MMIFEQMAQGVVNEYSFPLDAMVNIIEFLFLN